MQLKILLLLFSHLKNIHSAMQMHLTYSMSSGRPCLFHFKISAFVAIRHSAPYFDSKMNNMTFDREGFCSKNVLLDKILPSTMRITGCEDSRNDFNFFDQVLRIAGSNDYFYSNFHGNRMDKLLELNLNSIYL